MISSVVGLVPDPLTRAGVRRAGVRSAGYEAGYSLEDLICGWSKSKTLLPPRLGSEGLSTRLATARMISSEDPPAQAGVRRAGYEAGYS